MGWPDRETANAYHRKFNAEHPELAAARAERYRLSHMEEKRKYLREWYWKDPRRGRAHQKVYTARKSGRIVRPESCEGCGKVCKPHAAHVDYDRPLLVIWLCPACHKHMDTNLVKDH